MNEVWSLGSLIIMATVVGAAAGLLGSAIGSFFVLRTKRDGYEPLFPPLRGREENKVAHNIDDFEVPNNLTENDINSEIEKIFAERADNDPNNPINSANSRMKEQM